MAKQSKHAKEFDENLKGGQGSYARFYQGKHSIN